MGGAGELRNFLDKPAATPLAGGARWSARAIRDMFGWATVTVDSAGTKGSDRNWGEDEQEELRLEVEFHAVTAARWDVERATMREEIRSEPTVVDRVSIVKKRRIHRV